MLEEYNGYNIIREVCRGYISSICIVSDLDNDILRRILDLHRNINNGLYRMILITSNDNKRTIRFSEIPEPIIPQSIYFSRFKYTLVARNIPKIRKNLEEEGIDTILLMIYENKSKLTNNTWYEYLEGYYRKGRGILGITYVIPYNSNYGDNSLANRYSFVNLEKLEDIIKNFSMLVSAYI